MEDKQLVGNKSKGYGYSYASLADIASQGFKIPKMRVNPTDFGEYIQYQDDTGEWQMGAKIVLPDMKGMNAAQAYGSALTYARRYTVMLALGLACDDDKKLETKAPDAKDAKPAREEKSKAQTSKPQQRRQKPTPQPDDGLPFADEEYIGESEREEITRLVRELWQGDPNAKFAYAKVTGYGSLRIPYSDFDTVISLLEGARDRADEILAETYA